MGNGMLDEIMALEKEIEESLAAERGRLDARLAQLREEAEEERREEERGGQEALAAARRRAGAEAALEVAALLEAARARAGRLAALDDDALLAIVRRHLRSILPGE